MENLITLSFYSLCGYISMMWLWFWFWFLTLSESNFSYCALLISIFIIFAHQISISVEFLFIPYVFLLSKFQKHLLLPVKCMRKQKKTFHLISIISENNVVGVLHWFFFSFFGLSPNDVTNIMGVVQFNFERVSGWSSNVTHSLLWFEITFEFVFLYSSTCIFSDYFMNWISIVLNENLHV